MATIFKLTITIGKGEDAHEREISVDPEEVPMSVLEDLEAVSLSSGKPDWKALRPIITELFGLTSDEFRAITVKQFVQIASALIGTISDATTIPNGSAPLPPSG